MNVKDFTLKVQRKRVKALQTQLKHSQLIQKIARTSNNSSFKAGSTLLKVLKLKFANSHMNVQEQMSGKMRRKLRARSRGWNQLS